MASQAVAQAAANRVSRQNEAFGKQGSFGRVNGNNPYDYRQSESTRNAITRKGPGVRTRQYSVVTGNPPERV